MYPKFSLLRPALFTLVLAFSLHATSHARGGNWSDAPFGKGDNSLAFGAGFGIDYGYAGAAGKPAFMAILDYGVAEIGPGTIGIGAIIGYKSSQHNYDWGNYSVRSTNIIAGARATFHVTALSNRIPNLDAYGGVMLGARIWNYYDNYSEAMGISYKEAGITPVSGPFIGVKYNFSSSFGAWTEVGYDISFVKFGLHVNF